MCECVCVCVWLVLRCGLSRRLYSFCFFLKLAVDVCVYVHFSVRVCKGCVLSVQPQRLLITSGPAGLWLLGWSGCTHTHTHTRDTVCV